MPLMLWPLVLSIIGISKLEPSTKLPERGAKDNSDLGASLPASKLIVSASRTATAKKPVIRVTNMSVLMGNILFIASLSSPKHCDNFA
jgi:hypothetical protein